MILENRTELKFEVRRSGNRVKRKDVLWAYVNHRNPDLMETIRLYDYESHEDPIKIKAEAFYPDGSKWVLNNEDVEREKINFSNAFVNTFSIPKYQQKTLIKLVTERRYVHPEFIGTFKLRHKYPTLYRKLSLTLPEECNLKYGVENNEQAEIKTSSIKKSGLLTIDVSAKELSGIWSKKKTIYPEQWHVAFYASFPPSGKQSYSWQQLGNHYLDHLDTTFEVSPEIEALGKSIGGETRKELIKNSFNTIVQKIRYHADADGGFAFFPRKASVILDHGYGDCKEISTILRTVLREKSIIAHLSLISTWGYFQPIEKYPSLDNFNHLILSAPSKNGGDNFIDGTQTWADSDSSYYPLVGRTAYVLEPDNSRLVSVLPEENFESRVVTRSKINQESKGHWMMEGQITLYGFPALRLFNTLHWNNTTDKNSLVRSYIQKEFGVYPLKMEFKAPHASEITINYKSSIQENFIALEKGGIRFSIPDLFRSATDRSLARLNGPIFVDPFEQHDTWELSFTPNKNDLKSITSSIADCRWSATDAMIKRSYVQRHHTHNQETGQIADWIEALNNLTNSISWR